MFERSVNIFFGKQIFKGIPTKVDGKFMHHDPAKNPFQEYLKKKTAKAVLTKALMSFCYNTHRHSSYWNIRQKYFYLYHLIKKRGKETYEETLSGDLVDKIIRNIPNEYFMERVQAIIADYHILLDDKGNIKGIDDKIAGLRTQFPNQFETDGGKGGKIDPQPLPGGEDRGHTEPKTLAEALEMQYNENRE